MKTRRHTTALNLNAAEQVLVDRLMDVHALENSMDNIRRKYDEAWEALLKRSYPALDYPVVRANDKHGVVGCGKRIWLSTYPNWPSGFFIENISLKTLCASDADQPYASIWIAPPKNLHVDLQDARKCIRQKAQISFTEALDERKLGSDISMWYYLPETRQELIGALARNGGKEFFAIMETYLEFFRPLVPLIDALFETASRR